MSDLVVIVPSRGRPGAVAELAAAFRETCTASTCLVFAMDKGESFEDAYDVACAEASSPGMAVLPVVVDGEPASMVNALNGATQWVLTGDVKVIAFMGDDHRPRTKGWDAAYLAALAEKPGFVYGNDLLQGANLPTQVAMSAEVVRALGWMAPPTLVHLAVDNWWLELGQAADCITYLPDVVVEHLHPIAHKAKWDEGYKRVNAPEMYQRDLTEFERLRRTELPKAVEAVKNALAVSR